ncbi:hypothetical protein ACX80N_12605 [Arthrobacter sp. MDT2-16]
MSMLASHYFSHRQVEGVSVRRRKALLEEEGVSWDALGAAVKQGSLIDRHRRERPITYVDGRDGQEKTLDVVRNEWTLQDAPAFERLAVLGLVARTSPAEVSS